jgi:hypothetical protein
MTRARPLARPSAGLRPIRWGKFLSQFPKLLKSPSDAERGGAVLERVAQQEEGAIEIQEPWFPVNVRIGEHGGEPSRAGRGLPISNFTDAEVWVAPGRSCLPAILHGLGEAVAVDVGLGLHPHWELVAGVVSKNEALNRTRQETVCHFDSFRINGNSFYVIDDSRSINDDTF